MHQLSAFCTQVPIKNLVCLVVELFPYTWIISIVLGQSMDYGIVIISVTVMDVVIVMMQECAAN